MLGAYKTISEAEFIAIVFLLVCYLFEDYFIAFEVRLSEWIKDKLRRNKRFMAWLDKPQKSIAESIGEDLPGATILKGWKKL